jgi:LEA14-like dessication related protein
MNCKWGLFTVALTLFLAGCAGMEKLIQSPSVNVAGVSLRDLSFEAVTLDFDIRVDNPNPFGVSLSQLDYRFTLENNQMFSGSEKQNMVIAAAKGNHLHFPITLNFKELIALVQNLKDLDTLNYHFEGHIIPGGILSSLTIPFSKKGAVPNVRLPQISLKNLKINKWSLSGMDLDLALTLKNPNAFGFNIGKFKYDIRLKNNPVASGLSENLATLPARGSGEIRLPIKIDLLGAAASLTSVLSGGQTECSITGQAGLGSPFGQLELPFEAKQTISILK